METVFEGLNTNSSLVVKESRFSSCAVWNHRLRICTLSCRHWGAVKNESIYLRNIVEN